MSSWRCILVGCLMVLAAMSPAVAQIEQQAQTYDLTLDDCLAWTFRQYPEIQRLRADVDGAVGTKIVFRSRALPQLFTQTGIGLRGGNLYNSPQIGPHSTNNATVLNPTPFSSLSAWFSQPLIDVGIPPSLRRGRLQVVIAQQNLNREVTDRLHEARTTFLRALYLRDLIVLHEDIDQQLQANVRTEQQRLDAGTVNQEALKSAKIQELNLQLELSNLRGDHFAAVTRITELCGLNLNEDTKAGRQLWLPRPVGELQYVPAKVDLPRESAYALEHRADLKLLAALIDATAADKRITQADYFPLVSVVGSGLFIPENYLLTRQTQIVPGQQTQSSEGRAGVAMSWQVIDNGRVTGASHRLEATREAYKIDLHKLEQNIPRELATVEGSLQDADARRAALVKSAAEAEENLKLIETQVAVGQATQLDFLNAQRNLLSVRAGLEDATYSHEVARAELDRVTGRYLQFHFEGVP
ncbi:MAG: TolC family protein [Verrucomicrobiia bacterium]|jgi:outer membrane protein TolC